MLFHILFQEFPKGNGWEPLQKGAKIALVPVDGTAPAISEI